MRMKEYVARRSDYEIRDIPVRVGRDFINALHYAGGSSRTAVAMHGLFRIDTGELVGVAQWLPPTKVAAMSVSEDWKSVLSLSRLVVLDTEPQNVETILIGASLRKIQRDDPRWTTFLTYADTGEGHTGIIYRASNWEELPAGKPTYRWIDPQTGRHVATKSTRTRTKEEMIRLGYTKTAKTTKRKFVYKTKSRKTSR